jgi:hypothetical protein
MAISGLWKDRVGLQSGATKWGTGYNPIHGVRAGAGRSDKPPNLIFSTTHTTDQMPKMGIQDDIAPEWHYGDTDVTNPLYGYNDQTGLSDQPRLGDAPMSYHTDSDGWPSAGPYRAGVPGGGEIRSFDHGAEVSNTPKQQPYETVTEGWENKQRADVEDEAKASDPSQYEMQTSMTQRNKVRSGSQRGGGSASEYSADVPSRLAPQKMKIWSGLLRHYDMEPRQQDLIIRPWWTRSAFVGPTGALWNENNEMYVSEPIQRTLPPDPDLGPASVSSVPPVDYNMYGYQGEDVLY